MNGLYLYCIRERMEGAPAISSQGIDGKGEVFTLAYRDIEAVISPVSLAEFASEEIQHKAQDDLQWIKDKALIHEGVVEEAIQKRGGGLFSLIPMRFGAVFNARAGIEAMLAKDYLKIVQVLDKIRGNQEWSVKVYLSDQALFERMIKAQNTAIQEKEKELAAMPEGMAFFMEEELKAVVAGESAKVMTQLVETIFDRINSNAVALVKNRILEKELTGRRDPMVLNTACLIPATRIEAFKQGIESIRRDIQPQGLVIEAGGPWPSYNFCGY